MWESFMGTIASKELREKLYDFRFIILITLLSIVTTLSMVNGFVQIEAANNYVEAQQKDALESLKKRFQAQGFFIRTYRTLSPLEIFHSGISPAVGVSGNVPVATSDRVTIFSDDSNPLREDFLSRNPKQALFFDFRFSYVIIYIFSLVCLLLSFNSISGEREDGTLQLSLSNPISRTDYYLGKLVGGYFIVFFLLLIPTLAGLAILQILFPIDITPEQLLTLLFFFLAAYLYLCFFYSIGLVASSMVNASFLSFIIALSVWLFLIEVAPRTVTSVASLLTPTISHQELKIQKNSIWREMSHRRAVHDALEKYVGQTMTSDEYNKIVNDARGGSWQEVNAKIKEKQKLLDDEYLNKRIAYFETVRNVARFSPASSLSFIANRLFFCDTKMMQEFPRQTMLLKETYTEYIKKKQSEFSEEEMRAQYKRLYEVVADENGYARVSKINERPLPLEVNLSDFPVFNLQVPEIDVRLDSVLLDFLILFLLSVVAGFGGLILFARYDVRS
jgi:ABC-type transport system involved in multi-copper enzyme maturation permease subunit